MAALAAHAWRMAALVALISVPLLAAAQQKGGTELNGAAAGLVLVVVLVVGLYLQSIRRRMG